MIRRLKWSELARVGSVVLCVVLCARAYAYGQTSKKKCVHENVEILSTLSFIYYFIVYLHTKPDAIVSDFFIHPSSL